MEKTFKDLHIYKVNGYNRTKELILCRRMLDTETISNIIESVELVFRRVIYRIGVNFYLEYVVD